MAGGRALLTREIDTPRSNYDDVPTARDGTLLSSMWADNETTIDLLGFDYLVDSLLVVLTEPRLLPVTVGLAGDWGSGKTSLMTMAAAQLHAEDSRFVTVSFSPWRFEDYEDVKTALMASVIAALEERVDSDPTLRARVGQRLAELRERVWRLGLARTAATGSAVLAGADLGLAAAAGEAAQSLAQPPTTLEPSTRPYDNVARFRSDFASLMQDLGDDVRAVVVFVDDLDRCLTDAVVDTFEAIRLFLHVDKTAYVVGADQRLVQAAIDHRYPGAHEGDDSLGRNYLEKILQVTIAIPPLSEPEVETYVALLLAELEIDTSGYAALLAAAREHRGSQQLAVAMNEGIARAALGEVPDGLAGALALASRISPTLARGLRGNPRQIKRFLNTFVLRQRTAARRDIQLDPGVLAKLMVLEELGFTRFEQLFEWQLEQDGRPAQLADAEAVAREGRSADGLGEDVRAWIDEPRARAWLELDPPLAEHALGVYFFFARDRLSPAAAAARLAPALQELLGRLCSDAGPRRRPAVTEAVALPDDERRAVYFALLERAARDPSGAPVDSALEVAQQVPALIVGLVEALAGLSLSAVPPALPLKLRVAFQGRPEFGAVFDRWAAGPKALRLAVHRARSN